LKSKEHPDAPLQMVPCCCVLLNETRRCDSELFSAINDAGLVYDGGVVVNESFLTNDPSIYAVGDFTRYSRRYKNAADHSK
jgi:thioredoxin reductase